MDISWFLVVEPLCKITIYGTNALAGDVLDDRIDHIGVTGYSPGRRCVCCCYCYAKLQNLCCMGLSLKMCPMDGPHCIDYKFSILRSDCRFIANGIAGSPVVG
ncbi:hypothetical protein Nepgr_007885 [Nepenthes gracilis]|uniref:Uncharacterized protein n=1 Tax=Nepenthes gracilis TaxID=150966 RepID=A0AAD3XIV7_NEPGR|nr:hypothetical protein Nepgr_007885 [Nepenthes gracilis]